MPVYKQIAMRNHKIIFDDLEVAAATTDSNTSTATHSGHNSECPSPTSILEGRPYLNFINSLKSDQTKYTYRLTLLRYVQKYKIKSLDEMISLPIQQIEDKLVDYLLDLRKQDLSSSFIRLNFSVLKHFYFMNDVRINKEKIAKFLGEFKRKNTDRGYTTAEIRSILEQCDLRTRVIVTTLCSTSMRIGAIAELRHLKKIEEYGIYKFTIYENTNSESICFGSPENAAYIDSYLEYRTRAGEHLNGESFFIREQFDANDIAQVRKHGRGVTTYTISNILYALVLKSGIRKVNHNYTGRERTKIPLNHGYRKWWTHEAVEAKMNPEIREMLLSHSIGLAGAYYRPSEAEMAAEYMRAIDNGYFIISEEKKLKRRVEVLTIEKSKVDLALSQIEDMKKQIGLT